MVNFIKNCCYDTIFNYLGKPQLFLEDENINCIYFEKKQDELEFSQVHEGNLKIIEVHIKTYDKGRLEMYFEKLKNKTEFELNKLSYRVLNVKIDKNGLFLIIEAGEVY